MTSATQKLVDTIFDLFNKLWTTINQLNLSKIVKPKYGATSKSSWMSSFHDDRLEKHEALEIECRSELSLQQ